MKQLLLFLILLVFTACIGCGPPMSEQALSDAEKPKPDNDLFGIWEGTVDEETVVVHFNKGTERQTEVVMVLSGKKDTDVLCFKAFPVEIDKKKYLSVAYWVPNHFEQAGADEAELPWGYCFAWYEIKDGKLSIALMNSPYVAKIIEAGKLKGTVTKEKPMIVEIEDTRARITDLIKNAKPEDLFEPFLTDMKRIKPE